MQQFTINTKKLITERITRCKEIIRQFHLSEDCGLSITKIALEIDPAYSKIRADLEEMIVNWNEFNKREKSMNLQRKLIASN